MCSSKVEFEEVKTEKLEAMQEGDGEFEELRVNFFK